MRLCCMRDNDLFVKFLMQPYLFLFLDVSGDLKLCLFNFPIFCDTDTPALQLATKSCWKVW